MTQDEIIEMAREVYGTTATEQEIRLAKLVAEAEREACAKILDANAMACESPIMRSLLQSNAQAIRVRGQA